MWFTKVRFCWHKYKSFKLKCGLANDVDNLKQIHKCQQIYIRVHHIRRSQNSQLFWIDSFRRFFLDNASFVRIFVCIFVLFIFFEFPESICEWVRITWDLNVITSKKTSFGIQFFNRLKNIRVICFNCANVNLYLINQNSRIFFVLNFPVPLCFSFVKIYSFFSYHLLKVHHTKCCQYHELLHF